MSNEQRVRVRKISKVEGKSVISKQNCLSVSHIGEALDRFAGMAKFGHFGEVTARELHHGHPVEVGMKTGGTADCGEHCVVVDAVPVQEPLGDDEIKVK